LILLAPIHVDSRHRFKEPAMKFRLTAATLVCAMTMISASAFSQNFDAAAEAKWSKVENVHFEVVGEIADKHVQIPPVDADLYADVKDRVTLSFDWNRKKNIFVGLPKFQNYPGTATNLSGMQLSCKDGKINGPYEHFDIVEIKQAAPGQAVELIGKRVHPETLVSESCGPKLRPYKGGVTAQSEHIAPPDPQIFAMAGMLPANSPIKVTPDGKSMVMRALNNNWVWTYTPTAK
jgi:hypothetical protein